MSLPASAELPEYGPWHPGISSELPARLLPLATVFRPEHVFTSLDELRELRDLTGLALEELVVFRPQRLVVHELLIRVTADLVVPDGSKVEDLGINFRRMTHTILTRHIDPHMDEIVAAYEALRREVAALVEAELAALLHRTSTPATGARCGGIAGLLRRFAARREPPRGIDVEREREERVLREWTSAAQSVGEPLRRAVYRALSRVVAVILAKHGRLWGDSALVAPIATGMACNEHGSEVIGALIEPHLVRAVEAEGYRRLPMQAQPVVMNTKGASASGKSTMRPLQKRLAAEIGVGWSDFALISPDIWRKYLLDYGSLGEHFRYAGTFTGLEVAIIDQKLDRYMAHKAERGQMSHLLIDRFRFDSFATDSDEAGSNLLTRFGHTVYLFFMITPPHETVERSWKRGLEVGRFKAVDDLLAHNVEAYTGMPQLFFTWALRAGMSVRYEFLDNDVPYGERPRTIAFGWKDEMVILDVKALLDIERYRKIDVDAKCPEDVSPDVAAMAADRNTQFLRDCARRLAALNFADRDTGRVYARLDAGRLSWTDPEALEAAAKDPQTRAGVLAVAPEALTVTGRSEGGPTRLLAPARFHTLGRWGGYDGAHCCPRRLQPILCGDDLAAWRCPMTKECRYAVTETLRNGLPVKIRAVRPDDRDRMVAAFHKLEPESVYTRFFTYKDELSDAELKHFTEVDFDRRVVLLVTTGSGEDETVIGGGSYTACFRSTGGSIAEVGFIVEEDYHGLGIAGRLLHHLAVIALERGIDQFEAEVLPQNRAMLVVFARSGFPMTQERVEGTIRVAMDLRGKARAG